MKTTELDIDFEKSIAPWLGKTLKMVHCHMQDAFIEAELDLTKEQMVVLKKLHEVDGLNQNKLAFLTYRDKSSLARLLSKMETKGYIKREQSEDDKRINQVFLTEHGKVIFKKTRPIIQELINRMENNITEAEKKQMITILKKVLKNFGED